MDNSVTLTDLFNLGFWGIAFTIIVYKFIISIRLVPTKKAYIVERLGKYHKTLEAGFHALIPFIDRVTFIQDLKERTIDVPPQNCFTKDEVNVEVDGVIYMSVIDPTKASYGVSAYVFAAIELAQTTTRSVIGTLDLDKTFEERDLISSRVVEVLNNAGDSWGIRVHRYEIKNISPPGSVQNSMEKQVTAERERRAILATSEGDKQARLKFLTKTITEKRARLLNAQKLNKTAKTEESELEVEILDNEILLLEAEMYGLQEGMDLNPAEL